MPDVPMSQPELMISVREVFGIDTELRVPAFSEGEDHVPEIDPAYRFNPDVTLALLAGFSRDRRVMVPGLHGTGKASHIEQVAARPNWPCGRVTLGAPIRRPDLAGTDAVALRAGPRVPECPAGIAPSAL